MTSETEKSGDKPVKGAGRTLAICLAVLVLLGGGYTAWWYKDAPALTRYEPILAKVASHQIVPQAEGMIDLSKNYSGLTPRNIAYVTWNDDGSFMALFPTYYGQGVEVAGLLYTSRPLRDEDMHFRSSAIRFNQKLVHVGSYGDLLLEKRINPSWYHVSYKLQ